MKPNWIPDDAASGVRSAELSRLLVDHWRWEMTESPVWATRLGIHRFDDRLGDRSEVAIAARRKQNREFLARARALDEKSLEPRDAATLRLFIDERASSVATDVCEYELWSLSPRSNPVSEWNNLHEAHTLKNPTDARNLIARHREIPRVIGEEIAISGAALLAVR
jgi:uncharacterized protein (DUF885 family)